MKILTAQQIRDWDAYTIANEPIDSAALMERAAQACMAPINEWLNNHPVSKVVICCGKGNNGGDGLAIARMLSTRIPVHVVIVAHARQSTADFDCMRLRLNQLSKVQISELNSVSECPALNPGALIIDALTGTGLSKPLTGITADLVQLMNASGCPIIAIDLPSGLPADLPEYTDLSDWPIIHASLTLTFQLPKWSLLFPEGLTYAGKVKVLDIGLDPAFPGQTEGHFNFLDLNTIRSIWRQRPENGHKGRFGHVYGIGGSFGKMGAALLMSEAALRCGCGLMTTRTPRSGYTILQTALPECMADPDEELYEIRNFPIDLNAYQSVVVGPGLGQHEATYAAFKEWIQHLSTPVVCDADALNMISRLLVEQPELTFPEHTILTPHPKEFDRMAGISVNHPERLHRLIHFAVKHRVTVVLKGPFTRIATPDGQVFFNATGNVALATGGSGDVLSGMIASFLAQGYPTIEAACLGVYLHGATADDIRQNQMTLLASDLCKTVSKLMNQIFT